MNPGATFFAAYVGLWGILLIAGTLADLAMESGYGSIIGSALIVAVLLGVPMLIAYAVQKEP